MKLPRQNLPCFFYKPAPAPQPCLKPLTIYFSINIISPLSDRLFVVLLSPLLCWISRWERRSNDLFAGCLTSWKCHNIANFSPTKSSSRLGYCNYSPLWSSFPKSECQMSARSETFFLHFSTNSRIFGGLCLIYLCCCVGSLYNSWGC